MNADETQTVGGDFLFVTHRERCAEIEKVLAQGNLKVARVESGGQALAALATEPWTVMVADAQLPDMDGIELAREALVKKPNMYVLLGDIEPPSENFCNKAALSGVAGIVGMPYNPDEVFPLLWSVIEFWSYTQTN